MIGEIETLSQIKSQKNVLKRPFGVVEIRPGYPVYLQDLLPSERVYHINVEARVGVPKSTIAETGMGVTSRP